MLLENFQLARPWLLIALAILPLYYYLRLRIIYQRALPYAPRQYSGGNSRSRLIPLQLALEIIVIGLTLIALAAPFSESRRRLYDQKGVDIAFALDVSATMQARDFSPNRLEALKKITADFIERGSGHRIALYVFSGDVFLQAPLTPDQDVLLEMLEGLSYSIIDHSKSGGTAIGDALLMAGDGLLRNRLKKRDQALILITDGENNSGIEPELAAAFLRANNIRFYVIGIGRDKPTPVYVNDKPFVNVRGEVLYTSLDDRRLRGLTEAAGGRYFRARNINVLSEIFSELSRLENAPLETGMLRVRRYYADRLALAAILFFGAWALTAGFYIRRPWR